jgi:hypothetical protein
MESLSPLLSPEGRSFLPYPRANINGLRILNQGRSKAMKTGELSPAEVADLCLGQLARDPEQLARFMRIAGYSPDGLRKAVGSGQLQQGLVDYFAQNEPLMLALCAENRLRPEDFMRVWALLNPAR